MSRTLRTLYNFSGRHALKARLPVLLALAALTVLLWCMSVEAVILLGEKQEPTFDRLLPDVARFMAFNKDGTKLIAKGMGGTVVEWDIAARQKREVTNIDAKRWFAYAVDTNQLLVRKADDDIVLLSVASGEETRLTHGEYESGDISADGTLVVLTNGETSVEVWQIQPAAVQKLKTLETAFPVRNGLAISADGNVIAAAEGTYHEGHQTVIEVWYPSQEGPARRINTGTILGVWNLLFSPDGTMLAVDSQHQAQSGIRVWEVETGRQLLSRDGFEAYWTRALAFSPSRLSRRPGFPGLPLHPSGTLASGDEGGNLVLWDIHTDDAVWRETYPTGIQSIAFSPNGESVAVALWDATIQILQWREQ